MCEFVFGGLYHVYTLYAFSFVGRGLFWDGIPLIALYCFRYWRLVEEESSRAGIR